MFENAFHCSQSISIRCLVSGHYLEQNKLNERSIRNTFLNKCRQFVVFLVNAFDEPNNISRNWLFHIQIT